jgi:Ubiquitin-like domain
MEELIRQAFLHVENLGPHVAEGHYDLVGPNGEIVLPRVWESTIQPDWSVSMHMWPMPEPPKPGFPPGPMPGHHFRNGHRSHRRHGRPPPGPPPSAMRGPLHLSSMWTTNWPPEDAITADLSRDSRRKSNKSNAGGWMRKAKGLFNIKNGRLALDRPFFSISLY